jgi:tetrahydromethanopterin S-methyltransferase subunit G
MSEMVSKDQFDEFTKRMEQGFAHVDQRFAHVDQRFSQVDQRFDEMIRRFDSLQADIRQMRNWLVGLYGIVVFGFIGTIFLSIIKSAAVSGKPTP